MGLGALAGLLLILAAALTGCDNQKKSDKEEATPEEHKEETKATEEPEEQPCTSEAQVLCTSAIEGSEPVQMLKKKDKDFVEIGKISQLNKKDIERKEAFKECKLIGKCTNDKEDIENQEWQAFDNRVRQGENKEILNKEYSYMICTKGYGIIYFKDAGQEFINTLEGMFISYVSDDFIKWLTIAEGYTPYPYHDTADNPEAQARHNVTLGVGFTFDNQGTNWDILKKVLGWTDEEILAITQGVYSGEDYSNSEYEISEEEAYELFRQVAEKKYMPNLNACIKAYNDENGSQMTYSQQQLEAMFDYSYNNGLSPTEDTEWEYSSKVNDPDTIIYYYVRNDQKGGVSAVKKFGNGDRRRLNQMNLYFYEDYDFLDKSGEELNPLRTKLGF